MFDTRISQSWGAGGTILREFLLERLVGDDGSGIAMFEARRKSTGKRVWLKCQLNNADAVLLAAEAAVWDSLVHPNILTPLETAVSEEKPYIVFPWSGEVALDSVADSAISVLDRLRIALGLLRAVQYLQSLDVPVFHGRLSESNIWLSASNHWPLLVGFENARSNADADSLALDRRDCWLTVQRIIEPSGDNRMSGRVEAAADQWLMEGRDVAAEFAHELERVFVAGVTANL